MNRSFNLLLFALALAWSGESNAAERPNILFISIDDLNDWIGCLGGHPQAKTPNIDRLAASGVLFTNAHCPAPACNPSLPKLKWHSAKDSVAPSSKPDGDKLDVIFNNQSGQPAKVFWMDRQGRAKPYGTLEAGWRKPYSTRPGAVWLITDTNERELGHFVVGDRGAQAIIPAQ